MIGGTGCTKHCQMSLLAKRLPAASFVLFLGRERQLVSYRTSKRPWPWTSEPRHFTVICISSPSNRHSKKLIQKFKIIPTGHFKTKGLISGIQFYLFYVQDTLSFEKAISFRCMNEKCQTTRVKTAVMTSLSQTVRRNNFQKSTLCNPSSCKSARTFQKDEACDNC